MLAPGSFFGPAGAGYLRLALVPTLAECERAAERLDALLAVTAGRQESRASARASDRAGGLRGLRGHGAIILAARRSAQM